MKSGMWLLLAAGIGAAASLPVDRWAGTLRASIWNNGYARGLGAAGWAESRFSRGYWCARLGYAYFSPRYGILDPVHEVEIVAGPKWEFHPASDAPIYPRLGLNAGVSSNWEQKIHLMLGGDAEGVIPLKNRWSLVAAFQPGYSLGAESRMFWRVALGAMLHAP